MAQKELVRKFLENRETILGFIFALTRNYAAAEEIFQEVALVILEEAGKEAAIGNFLAWVREVARRRVSEFYRKRAKLPQHELPDEALEEAVALAFTENDVAMEGYQLRLQFLQECLSGLPERSRQIVESYYRGVKSIREIAANIAWTEGSIKVALCWARKALADCIAAKLRTAEVGHGS